jgi:hypothetical protein
MLSSVESSLRARAASPRRFRPAQASTIAAYSPRSSFASRVSTLPRSGPHLERRETLEDLRLAPQAGSPDDGAGRELVEAAIALRDERIARIVARCDRRERESGRQLGGHVLHRVHCEVGSAVGERVFELLDEETLAARFGEACLQ